MLLSQKDFFAAITQAFRGLTPPGNVPRDVDVALVVTLSELEDALANSSKTTRLISFGSGVIVPAAVLARLSGTAYNFHPGPPAYPGIFPSVFALYDGATRFGVTLHEMKPEVDSGPIVAF
ncbi:MAG: hypothetical protein EXQ84_03955 [Rhodospirillaceae bacterium]|nr:hypothetical protein [Rhodospirillaceae bacterium]